MSKKKGTIEKKKEEYYKGVTFLSFQSGSDNEPSELVLKLITKFTVDLHKERIRVYTNIQMGKPGGCPVGGCH